MAVRESCLRLLLQYAFNYLTFHVYFGKGNFILHVFCDRIVGELKSDLCTKYVFVAAMAALNQLVTSVLRFEISSNMEHLKA